MMLATMLAELELLVKDIQVGHIILEKAQRVMLELVVVVAQVVQVMMEAVMVTKWLL
jgi:hypothetical protein